MTNERYLDSSVYLHAYLKIRRKLSTEESETKQRAIRILERVEDGYPVAISVVHISEISNIVEARLGVQKAQEVLETILATENISIIDVSRRDYEEALVLSHRYGVGPNDALAATLCRRMTITEAYSFDKHFDNFAWLKRVT
nr:type II toxin-antitoxin system VapC family toxin [Candidatus Njordarchaeota archaeon]